MEIASKIISGSSTSLPIGKERNSNGELKYNVELIIEGLNNYTNDKKMIDYICLLFKEKRKEVFTIVYQEYGKMFLIKMIEKALTIDNEGGLTKINISNQIDNKESNKRTIGGILFYLLKHCDEIPKKTLNKIFWRNNKKKHAKRKFNSLFTKMDIEPKGNQQKKNK